MAAQYSPALINLIWKVFPNSDTPNENKLFLTTIWVPSNSHDPGSKVGVKVSASKVELWNSFDASRSGCRSQLGEILSKVKKSYYIAWCALLFTYFTVLEKNPNSQNLFWVILLGLGDSYLWRKMYKMVLILICFWICKVCKIDNLSNVMNSTYSELHTLITFLIFEPIRMGIQNQIGNKKTNDIYFNGCKFHKF